MSPFLMSFALESKSHKDGSKLRKGSIETVFDAGRVAKLTGSRLKQINLIGVEDLSSCFDLKGNFLIFPYNNLNTC